MIRRFFQILFGLPLFVAGVSTAIITGYFANVDPPRSGTTTLWIVFGVGVVIALIGLGMLQGDTPEETARREHARAAASEARAAQVEAELAIASAVAMKLAIENEASKRAEEIIERERRRKS